MSTEQADAGEKLKFKEASFKSALRFHQAMLEEDPAVTEKNIKNRTWRYFCPVAGCPVGSCNRPSELSKHWKKNNPHGDDDRYHVNDVITVPFDKWKADTGLKATAGATSRRKFYSLRRQAKREAEAEAEEAGENNNEMEADTDIDTDTGGVEEVEQEIKDEIEDKIMDEIKDVV